LFFMTTVKVRDVINGLTRKGFCKSNRHHKVLIFYYNGKKTSIFTKVSHGCKELNDYLIGKMSWQVKLDKKQFEDLVNCPLSHKSYLGELRKKGYFSKDQ